MTSIIRTLMFRLGYSLREIVDNVRVGSLDFVLTLVQLGNSRRETRLFPS
jgi:hypothetical protein